MDIILAITIAWVSALAGTGVAYSLLEKRLNIQEQRHRSRTRQEIEEVERTYTQRMQNRIDSLKSQYETQIQQLKASLGAIPAAPLTGSEPDATVADDADDADIPTVADNVDNADVATVPEAPVPSPETIAIPKEPEVNFEEGDKSLEFLTMPDSVPSIATPAISEVDPEGSLEAATIIEGFEEPDSAAIVSSLHAFSLADLAALFHPSSLETRIILAEQILEVLTAQQPLGIPSRPLIQALAALSRETEPQLRELAIRSLAQIRSPLTLPSLRRGLRDADPRVVKAAHQALEPWRAKAKVTPKITKAFRSAQRFAKAKR